MSLNLEVIIEADESTARTLSVTADNLTIYIPQLSFYHQTSSMGDTPAALPVVPTLMLK